MWRKCPVCRAETGDACTILSGREWTAESLRLNRPRRVAVPLERPHTLRKIRVPRRGRVAREG